VLYLCMTCVIHIHIYIQIYIYIYTYVSTYMHTCIHAQMHTHCMYMYDTFFACGGCRVHVTYECN
jgi:hypothetical protein